MTLAALRTVLDIRADAGNPATLWLRDDDVVEPCGPLDRLLGLAERAAVPVTIAVIPAFTGNPLAERLKDTPLAEVAVHGWSHENYAGPREKKQELGPHRPLADVVEELRAGRDRLSVLHGERFLPMMVPPWNRIDRAVVESLPACGYESLSVFGTEKRAPLAVLNTHVDIIDWHGTRGGRDHDTLFAEIAARLSLPAHAGSPTGFLTHCLVHDAAAWEFLEQLFEATQDHPGCRWSPASELTRAGPTRSPGFPGQE
ncbi:polysaccharide deacetylase family protein [Sinorhizobium sp. BG8]|uniref:polysaccharide deacetylase family protein n=1 Tax=Sinorhizobium sp. BG8 TaxID=2613773 RepID=UPI00193E7F87|nr:polysaccharide deacetylase family protein [Sinorhizobium sp. BG8]QRM53880.1 polysaccharide deacetylase family protein [Sinorhizobium sp. BG8]